MASPVDPAAVVPLRAAALAAGGYAGLAACVTLMFLGMRAVLEIGGACADGGPYVPVAPCPDATGPAFTIGMVGGLASLLAAIAGGTRLGRPWAAAPLLAWSSLFGALGWNFLEYGVVARPSGEGIDWGWAICGVVFWLLAAGPLPALGGAPGRAAARLVAGGRAARPGSPRGGASTGGRGPAPAGGPGAPGAPAPGAAGLVDRLRLLAELRERGLLAPAEYELAKAALLRELGDAR